MSSGVWPNNSLIVGMSLFRICSCKLIVLVATKCRVVSSFLKIGSKGLDKLNFSPLPFPLQKQMGAVLKRVYHRECHFSCCSRCSKFKAFWRNPSGLKMEPIKFRIPSSEPRILFQYLNHSYPSFFLIYYRTKGLFSIS